MENDNRNRNRYQDRFQDRESDWRNRNQENEDYNERNRGRSSDSGSSSSNYGSGQYGEKPGSGWNEEGRYGDSNDWNKQGRSSDMNRNYGDRNYGGNDFNRGSSRSYGTGEFDRSYDSDRANYGDYNRNERNRNRGNRDWWDKTTDEVSSWFGDEEAERRRRMDKINGPHRGKGPKGYTRSDEKIRDDVNDKLYHDPFVDASEIEVTVSDGDVTLTGSVDNRESKRRAEDIAEEVTGVSDVYNNLKVNKSSTLSSQDQLSKSSTKNISESYRKS